MTTQFDQNLIYQNDFLYGEERDWQFSHPYLEMLREQIIESYLESKYFAKTIDEDLALLEFRNVYIFGIHPVLSDDLYIEIQNNIDAYNYGLATEY